MIVDAEVRTDDWFRDRIFDVCVLGTGPAGITLARRLGTRGLSVGLFEAGGLDLTADSQDLYKGLTTGQPYYALDAARLRYFGGSSNHWGGWTRPLDAHDFEPNQANPLSGWPIGKADLDPYAAAADEILDLPADTPPPELFASASPGLIPRRFRFSRPTTRFGEKYRDELKRSDNIRVFFNANLIDLRLDDARRAVVEAVFRSYAREAAFAVKARVFALCLGGLENPRLLLNMNHQIAAGVGNDHDLVGRCFLEHPHAPVGRVVVRKPLTDMLVYSPTPAFMRDNRVLSFGLRIGDMDQWNAGDFTGPLAPQPPCTVAFDALLAAEMKKSPAACPAQVADAFVACEQLADRENRVKLTAERDRFGLFTIELAWHLSDTDRRTLKTAALEVAKRMAAEDVGRMNIVPWLMRDEVPTLDQLWGGNHHMGTTRMSADPRAGVVDGNLKIHSLENLYVGGSSVFATSGHANPTYTIVQLGLRLGDHLAERLQRS
jgi:choline dehydrogenase-like flavoprotein